MALREITVTTTGSLITGSSNNWLSSPLTPVSPDEEIIRLRGRHKTIQSGARTLDEMQLTPKKSSPRKGKTPQKLTPPKTPLMPLRTSPRKRLNLQDALNSASETNPTSSPKKRGSPNSKRLKLQTSRKSGTLEGALTALSHAQLVSLVKNLVIVHPEVEQSLDSHLPVPDLTPLEDKLNFLQRIIYRSIPSTRWESNRDSFCFRRISSHLEAFKREVVEQARKLVSNQQWDTAIDYFLLAWRYVRSLPDWDNLPHNKTKIQCFKYLAGVCLTAIKKGELQDRELQDILERLNVCLEDNSSLTPVIQHIEQLLM